jgi:hypothetical protein
MEMHTELGFELDAPDELAVTQVIARLRRAGDPRAGEGPLVRDPIGDERLDQFWRRRSVDGHC